MPADPIVVMEMLSSEYGWTPDEIRAQRIEDINAYAQILKTKRAIEKYQNQ